jgi:hypothetical protein
MVIVSTAHGFISCLRSTGFASVRSDSQPSIRHRTNALDPCPDPVAPVDAVAPAGQGNGRLERIWTFDLGRVLDKATAARFSDTMSLWFQNPLLNDGRCKFEIRNPKSEIRRRFEVRSSKLET